MTKGFPVYFALCIKNRMFYVLNDSIIATFSFLDFRLVLSNLAEITGKGQITHRKPSITSSTNKIAIKDVSSSSGIESQQVTMIYGNKSM